MKYALKIALVIAFACFGTGCGDDKNSSCGLIAINVSPTSTTLDHNAIPPGNQVRFLGFGQVPSGCVIAQANLTNITWSVSDPVNVSISNAQDLTYGTATCLGATNGSATITATAPVSSTSNQKVSGTASLTCR